MYIHVQEILQLIIYIKIDCVVWDYLRKINE